MALQLLHNSNSVTSPTAKNIPLHTALSVGSPSLTRTSLQAYQTTAVVLTFTHTGLTSFQVVISPMATASGVVPLLTSPSAARLTSEGGLNLSYSANSTYHITVTVSNAVNTQSTVTIHGTNPFLVPKSS